MIRYRLEFELPGLPRMQNPSGRPMHWAVLAKEKRGWQQAVNLAIMAAGPRPPLLPFKRAEIWITRFSSVEPDFDGCVSGGKRILDALRYAGIIQDDKMSNVGIPHYDWQRAKPGHGKIRVVVLSIPDQQGALNLPCPITRKP